MNEEGKGKILTTFAFDAVIERCTVTPMDRTTPPIRMTIWI